MTKIKLIAQSHHRNGVGGHPFSAAIFMHEKRRMLAIVMDAEDEDPGDGWGCFVLDLDKAAAGDIAFGSNSWRGDTFVGELRLLIEKASQEEHQCLLARSRGEAS